MHSCPSLHFCPAPRTYVSKNCLQRHDEGMFLRELLKNTGAWAWQALDHLVLAKYLVRERCPCQVAYHISFASLARQYLMSFDHCSYMWPTHACPTPHRHSTLLSI